MNLMFRSPRLAKHLMLMCAPCFVSGNSVKSEPSMSYQGYVAPVEMSAFSYGTYNDPILAKPKSSKKSSKPKSSKRAKSSKNRDKRQMTAQPTDAPTSSPTPIPTPAPTTNETSLGCPDDDNYFRTCSNGTSFVSVFPGLADDETWNLGFMYISSVLNYTGDNITCDVQYSTEGIVLSWLMDNVGGPDSYRPICVYLGALSPGLGTIPDGRDSFIGVAFGTIIVFAVKKDWLEEDEHEHESGFERSLNNHNSGLGDSCDAINRGNKGRKKCGGNNILFDGAEAIVAAIEGNPSPSHVESFQQVYRPNTLKGKLNGTDFNDAFAEYTGLDVHVSGAFLNETEEVLSVEAIAICTTLYYVSVFLEWSIPCKYFQLFDCQRNGFVDYEFLANNGTEYCQPPTPPPTPASCPSDDNYYRTCYNGTSFTSTLPYPIGDDEEYDAGLMFLSSVFNAHADNITCNHLYQLEEITLSYLLDNAGGPDSFRPLCVYAISDYSSLTIYDNTRSILGAAFPVIVVFAVNKGWKDREEDGYFEPVFDRRLSHHNGIGNSCDAINTGNLKAKKCGGNSRRLASSTEDTFLLVEEILASIKDTAPLSDIESSQPADQQITLNGELEGVDFNHEFASYTGLDVLMTGALLEETDYFNATRVAWCGALYYGATVWEDYPVLCEAFDILDCDINSFIDFDALAGNGTEYCCSTNSTTTKCEDKENLISFGNIEFTLN